MVIVLSERTADQCRADPGERLDLVVACVDVGNDLLGRERVVVVVRVGMVHQLVSAVNDRFRLLRILVRPVAHHKKSCLDLVFCQNIKDLLRIVRAPG